MGRAYGSRKAVIVSALQDYLQLRGWGVSVSPLDGSAKATKEDSIDLISLAEHLDKAIPITYAAEPIPQPANASVPSFAPAVWHDASTIWLSFPAIPGQAAGVMAFSLTEAGLAKALKAIRSLPMAPDPRILGSTKNAGKMGVRSPRVTVARRADAFDADLRQGTRDILRRLKESA